jgi:hypothetical protein
MSFFEQERALFDLLFDVDLREKFTKNRLSALKNYDLTTQELADFDAINCHGLALDARVRVDLILAQWCRSFPLTFSVLSSINGALVLVKRLVDSQTMRQAPNDRLAFFGTRLRQALIAKPLVALDELALVVAILDAELGMVSTSRLLKNSILTEQYQAATHGVIEDWLNQKVTLASYVSAAMIPLSYLTLKQALCPCLGAELWRSLNKTPLSVAARQALWQKTDNRLLVAQAKVAVMSVCEPLIEHQTVELAEGFASLFEYVNGTMSVQQILQQLQQIGAPEPLLQSIKQGFKQLWDKGMVLGG